MKTFITIAWGLIIVSFTAAVLALIYVILQFIELHREKKITQYLDECDIKELLYDTLELSMPDICINSEIFYDMIIHLLTVYIQKIIHDRENILYKQLSIKNSLMNIFCGDNKLVDEIYDYYNEYIHNDKEYTSYYEEGVKNEKEEVNLFIDDCDEIMDNDKNEGMTDISSAINNIFM